MGLQGRLVGVKDQVVVLVVFADARQVDEAIDAGCGENACGADAAALEDRGRAKCAGADDDELACVDGARDGLAKIRGGLGRWSGDDLDPCGFEVGVEDDAGDFGVEEEVQVWVEARGEEGVDEAVRGVLAHAFWGDVAGPALGCLSCCKESGFEKGLLIER